MRRAGGSAERAEYLLPYACQPRLAHMPRRAPCAFPAPPPHAQEELQQPARRAHGRAQLVLRGVVAVMAAVAVVAVRAAMSSPGDAPAALEQAPSAAPNITKVPGPSEQQWMQWEDAHGLPKECVPKKEWSTGPHGEPVFIYYADCSMVAKGHAAAALRSAAAAAQKKQGVVALASRLDKVVHAKSNGAADKEAARKRLATKAAARHKTSSSSPADLEPPALPSMLQKPKPKAKPVKKPVVQAMGVQVSEAKKSSRPLTLEQKLRKTFFDNRVKREEAKLIARDEQRAASLIVDPDAHVANDRWGGAKKAAPVPKASALAAKATGPAAAILKMIGSETEEAYLD